MFHRGGSAAAVTSSHVSVIDTGAISRARVENAATDVFVRLFRR